MQAVLVREIVAAETLSLLTLWTCEGRGTLNHPKHPRRQIESMAGAAAAQQLAHAAAERQLMERVQAAEASARASSEAERSLKVAPSCPLVRGLITLSTGPFLALQSTADAMMGTPSRPTMPPECWVLSVLVCAAAGFMRNKRTGATDCAD
jgi:hypothetical protein